MNGGANLFIVTNIGLSYRELTHELVMTFGIVSSAEEIGQEMTRLGKWWCRHFHSGDWSPTMNNYWVMKFKHIYGDANEEWMQEYHECSKCGRTWVYWDSGVDTWYPD